MPLKSEINISKMNNCQWNIIQIESELSRNWTFTTFAMNHWNKFDRRWLMHLLWIQRRKELTCILFFSGFFFQFVYNFVFYDFFLFIFCFVKQHFNSLGSWVSTWCHDWYKLGLGPWELFKLDNSRGREIVVGKKICLTVNREREFLFR